MARGDFPSSKQDQFVLRFPDGLRDRVKEKAEANGRSMNAEIIAAIESTIDMPDLNASDLRRMLDEEREATERIRKLLHSMFDTSDNMKELIKTYRMQNYQQAGMIESLSNIILMLDPPPEPAVLDLARRLNERASDFRTKYNEVFDRERDERPQARVEDAQG